MPRASLLLYTVFIVQPLWERKGSRMELKQFLQEAAAIQGLTGNEFPVARYIADLFAPLCDEVRITSTGSVIARKRGAGPKVMFAAHLDEIGLMVSKIEKDGSLRMGSVGGVDPRILPGMRVKVFGKTTLLGVVGAKAPHLLSAEEREKNYQRDDLHVDLGLPYDKVTALVQVGDLIQLETRFVSLQNDRVATKTADDRACVAMLYGALQHLQQMKHEADLYFVATCQEEIGSYGAKMAGYEVDPDFAVALDVCHASTPDCPPPRTFELTSLVATMGPYIQPVLRKKLMDVAKDNNIRVQTSVAARYTSTDADDLGVVRCGVPTCLLELPLKYMHTSVELIDMGVLKEGARLLAHFAAAVRADWEGELWN